jgi:hypothetical protein
MNKIRQTTVLFALAMALALPGGCAGEGPYVRRFLDRLSGADP